MKALTHIYGQDGNCTRCGMSIPMHGLPQRPFPGESVGVIESDYVAPVAYFTGEHDSNPPCEKSEVKQ